MASSDPGPNRVELRARRASAAQGLGNVYLDILVDGRSLADRAGGQLVTVFGWSAPETHDVAADELRGLAPPGADGRVAVFVCPDCSEARCASLTVAVTRSADLVEWSPPVRSRWNLAGDGWDHDADVHPDGWPGMRFPAAALDAALGADARRAAFDAGP